MSKHDRADVKPASAKELREQAERFVRDYFGPYLANHVRRIVLDLFGDVFEEGVLAGLCVRENQRDDVMSPEESEATLVLHGAADALVRVKPRWCCCASRSGVVCSPRRRPAECDTARQQGAYE